MLIRNIYITDQKMISVNNLSFSILLSVDTHVSQNNLYQLVKYSLTAYISQLYAFDT